MACVRHQGTVNDKNPNTESLEQSTWILACMPFSSVLFYWLGVWGRRPLYLWATIHVTSAVLQSWYKSSSLCLFPISSALSSRTSWGAQYSQITHIKTEGRSSAWHSQGRNNMYPQNTNYLMPIKVQICSFGTHKSFETINVPVFYFNYFMGKKKKQCCRKIPVTVWCINDYAKCIVRLHTCLQSPV